ncbi:hypothetical protein ACVWWL_000860 [Bradyrhizobium sp. USDA 3696]
MPRPPPPAIALITIAALLPSEVKNAAMSSSEDGPLVPAMIGTPQRFASCRAATLSPNNSSAAAWGPTKAMPASAQAFANAAFSLRKP